MANRLAAIHVGKKALGMDDDSYRLLLKDMFGKSSSKELTEREKGKLLKRFNDLGFKQKPYPNKPHNFQQSRNEMTKVEALLADMSLPWSYADAIAKRQFGIEKMAWIKKPEQFKAIIAALHVEQEKQQLWSRFEAGLKRKDMTLEAFEEKNKGSLQSGWKRNRRTLKGLIDSMLLEDILG